MAGFYRLAKSKWISLTDERTSFAGKTVLITGATGGLGLEAAKKIALLGPDKLIITARNVKKGQSAKSQIELHVQKAKRVGGSEKPDVDVYELDMNDSSGVKTFSDRIAADIPKLDAVILNAGTINTAWRKSTEGWEQTLQVNTISTVLLALLLLPKLLVAASPKNPTHLSFVSSGNARVVKPAMVRKYYDASNALQAMSAEKAWPGAQPQYGLSKLLLEYAMRQIAILPTVNPPSSETKVVVNSLCPGLCKTDLGRQYTDNSLFLRIFVWIFFTLFGRTAETGSRTYVSALTRGSESQGKMWKDDRYYDGGEMVESAEAKKFGEKMWKELAAVMESVEPKVRTTLAEK